MGNLLTTITFDPYGALTPVQPASLAPTITFDPYGALTPVQPASLAPTITFDPYGALTPVQPASLAPTITFDPYGALTPVQPASLAPTITFDPYGALTPVQPASLAPTVAFDLCGMATPNLARISLIYTGAFDRAMAHGLTRDNATDCACDLRLRQLEAEQVAPPSGADTAPERQRSPWTVENWVSETLRRQAVLSRREVSLDQHPAGEANQYSLQIATPGPTPTGVFLSKRLLADIMEAARGLTTWQYEVFRRCILDGETSASVARATMHSPPAVRAELKYVRKKLRMELAKACLTEAEFRLCLYEIDRQTI